MDVQNVQTKYSSLQKVAKAFSVSLSTVRKWRKDCHALAIKHPPYDLTEFAMCLIVNKLITADDLTDEVKAACANSLAGHALQNSNMGKIIRVIPKLDRRELVDGNIEHSIIKALAAAKPSPLLPEQSAVIAIASPKSAALFVDRVWTLDKHIPREIEFEFGTFEEKVMRGFVSAGVDRALEAKFGEVELEAMLEKDDAFFDMLDQKQSWMEQQLAPLIEQKICLPIQRASGRSISPFMSSEIGLSSLHQAGDFQTVAVTINALKLIDESQLTWEQVCEFRSDLESLKKLRRFLHWMDGEMVGKPLSFVQDELCLRLEDYEKAIRSWGINTTMGVFGALVDAKTWMSIFAAGIATAGAAFSPDIVATVGIAVLGLKVTHDVLKINIEESTRLRQDEIAYLHEVKKKLK